MGWHQGGFIQWLAPLPRPWDPRGLNRLALVHPDSAKGHTSSTFHFIFPEGFSLSQKVAGRQYTLGGLCGWVSWLV